MERYTWIWGLLHRNFGSLMSERMKLKDTEAPRVERAMTIWKKALNHTATERPECLVMDLMCGRQALFSWEAMESLEPVVVRGRGWVVWLEVGLERTSSERDILTEVFGDGMRGEERREKGIGPGDKRG